MNGLMDEDIKALEHSRSKLRRQLGLCALVVLAGVGIVLHGSLSEAASPATLRLATWNIAAINNNPFEYWITHSDPDYNTLMADVQAFVDAPAERDVPVEEVFSESRWQELKALMAAEGWDVDGTEARWHEDFRSRKIISGFLKDRSIGEKRLASMPDRVTNTIHTRGGSVSCRPTVINCYEGDLGSGDKWWVEWKQFMFATQLATGDGDSKTRPAAMLKPIKRAKYPAVSAEEEAMSLPLQTLSQAIFDAILVHIVNSVSPSGRWQQLRQEMCDALNRHKDTRTLEILQQTYGTTDAVFLQEAAASFRTSAAKRLGGRYIVAAPSTLDTSRDQNSLLLLRRDLFLEASLVDRTEEVMKTFDRNVPVAPGDLFVLQVDDTLGRPYLLASFHGDTNGLATIPVLEAVTALAARMPERRLIFGLDANTYEHEAPGKQDVLGFARAYVAKGLTSCWGDTPDPTNHTTYNARTYLQAQLQKAAKQSETAAKGDKNPKDFLLFSPASFTVRSTTKDNTGERRYVEDMVFPTLQFPSDHGVLSTTLEVQPPRLSRYLRPSLLHR